MFFRGGTKRKIIPSWFWILAVGVPVSIFVRWLIWWFFCPSYKRTAAVEIDAPRSDSIPIQIQKDDFNRLKGIGPKNALTLVKKHAKDFDNLFIPIGTAALAQLIL